MLFLQMVNDHGIVLSISTFTMPGTMHYFAAHSGQTWMHQLTASGVRKTPALNQLYPNGDKWFCK